MAVEGHPFDKRQLRFLRVNFLVFTTGYTRKEAQVHADMRLVPLRTFLRHAQKPKHWNFRHNQFHFPRVCPGNLPLTNLASHRECKGLGPGPVSLSYFNCERILVPIALFASLSRRGLGTRNEGLWGHGIFE